MKKILLVMPLMAISLLACNNGGGDNPGPTPETKLTVTFDAGDGEFPFVGKTTSLKVDPNENLVSVIRAVVSPVKTGTKFAYFTYKDGSNITYEDKITKNTVLEAKYINSTLDELSWDEIKLIAIGGHPRDYFHIGETKRVQLVQQDSKGDGADVISDREIYQTVRIIDFDKDYADPDNVEHSKFGITFEFANLISDATGCSLGVQWLDKNNTNSDDYENSTIRKALNGTGGATHFLWAEREAESWSTDYQEMTVYSMLPNKLTKAMGTVAKYTCHYKNDAWVDIPVKDKLFLLSLREMGYETPPQESVDHTSQYYYYRGHSTETDSIRVKKQISILECLQHKHMPNTAGHEATSYGVDNYAGYNSTYDPSIGGYYWLRNPMRLSQSSSPLQVSWCSEGGSNYSHLGGRHNASYAFSVAPAFCI